MIIIVVSFQKIIPKQRQNSKGESQISISYIKKQTHIKTNQEKANYVRRVADACIRLMASRCKSFISPRCIPSAMAFSMWRFTAE